jgi:sensor histidine kinase regulating citrate/malate metabolism
VYDICQIKAEKKNIAFNYQFSKRIPTFIHSDEKRLCQVLLNLLSNAIKFTDYGEVKFGVEVIDDLTADEQLETSKIRFTVEDTGVGISPEQLQKIFLPFEQVGDSFRKAEGTGLGLAISTQIVKMMGSKIQVESKLGQGSKFWFDLNLAKVTDELDLIYNNSHQSQQTLQSTTEDIIFPPATELVALYKAAKTGYVMDIQKEVNRIQNLDDKYADFTNKILQLMEELEDEAIVEMLKPYLS